jgi:ribosome biogenesis GTPase
MIDLEDLGWDEFFSDQSPAGAKPGECFAARVSRHDGQQYDVLAAGGARGETMRARLGGVLRYRAGRPQDLPAVGDWVLVQADAGELKTILAVYERRTRFVRQAAGQVTDEQVIATNVDTVFVVTSMNEEFEPRRLERYLVAVRAAGAQAVIVLNKLDLTEDPQDYIRRAEAVADGAPVVGMSALGLAEECGIDALYAWLGRGKTVVFVGSSGVGKSTIVNRLMGDEVQETRAIRQGDARGRHTTTTRQLLLIPNPENPGASGILIDTPGMREFQLWAHEDDAVEAFEDIEQLEAACRFRDCAHAGEPGCAVQAALDAGELTSERLASWHKLRRELEEQKLRQQAAARRARRSKGSKKR